MNQPEFIDVLANTRRIISDNLHPIDLEDVAISPEALEALGAAAREVLLREGVDRLSLGGMLKVFAAHLFWNEAGGELLMCGEVGGRAVCLPVPAGHWSVAVEARTH